uniref:Neurotransmitter-gated ion-channel ligand-binding domain-containing protein n=1 Tax=Ditylenchus dipsaci TaxID=166011 RepID=A0A915DNY6_9BILA
MMNLWKYPLDSQECSLRILSYAYPESVLRLRWSKDIDPPIDRNADILMPDMRLVDIKTGSCNGTYATGTWSCMTAVFYVQREMMHHIIQTYAYCSNCCDFLRTGKGFSIHYYLADHSYSGQCGQNGSSRSFLHEGYRFLARNVHDICVWRYGGIHNSPLCQNQEIHRSLPPNLIMDSTLSTLFGAGSNSTAPGMPEQAMGTGSNKHFQKHRKSTPAIMSHSQSAYDHFNSGKHVTLRPDEPDLHTIRIPEETTHLDWLHQDGNPSDEDEPSTLGYEESSFHTLYHDNENGGDRLNNNIYASGQIHKHNSFTSNAAEARLRVPIDTGHMPEESLGTTSPLHKRRLSTFGRPSVGKLRHQVFKRALSMKCNVQAQYNLKGRAMAINIDQKSRIIFPAAFILVNFGYWGFYLVLN